MEDVIRKEFPTARPEYAIQVTTERLPEGPWAVVAAVKHHSDYGDKTIDLPVPKETFESQANAEDFGTRMAIEWLEHNAPKAA